MSDKALILIGASVGSTIGGFVPSLWGGGFLSGWGVLTGALGGFAGIYLSYRYIHG